MASEAVAITGVVHSGKTTLAAEFAARGYVVLHTDDLKGLGWSEASEAASRWFDGEARPLCIEGVAVPRALRKWLAAHPTGKPCDRLIVLLDAHGPLTPGQETMGKGLLTVLGEILPALVARGVAVECRRQAGDTIEVAPDRVSLSPLPLEVL